MWRGYGFGAETHKTLILRAIEGQEGLAPRDDLAAKLVDLAAGAGVGHEDLIG
jgi:hypothetical protein